MRDLRSGRLAVQFGRRDALGCPPAGGRVLLDRRQELFGFGTRGRVRHLSNGRLDLLRVSKHLVPSGAPLLCGWGTVGGPGAGASSRENQAPTRCLTVSQTVGCDAGLSASGTAARSRIVCRKLAPSNSVERSQARCRSAPSKSAPVSVASVRFAPRKTLAAKWASVRSAPGRRASRKTAAVQSAIRRSAPARFDPTRVA